jgi:NAD(P)-dependent dehydrogenase (short-subunit alcohol dehydrogenase family)/fermentation-respiration switch protein FrsA (DUF1100 family)
VRSVEVEFLSERIAVRGDLLLPDENGPHPVVVIAGGWCYVKELREPQYAKEFVDRGFAALIFDYRTLGASDGEPRQHLDPWAQVEDYRNAISYLETRADIDADRIGVWGISYGGGHVLILGAIDPRVKAIVSNVPVIDGFRNMQLVHGSERFRKLQQAILDDRRNRFETGEYRYIGMSGTPSGPDTELATWPLDEIRTVFEELQRSGAPRHDHRSTLASVELLMQYNAAPYAERIVNKPVMMIVAHNDDITMWDVETKAFESIPSNEKFLLVLPSTSHMTLYSKLTALDLAARAAATWFSRHLMGPPALSSKLAEYGARLRCSRHRENKEQSVTASSPFSLTGSVAAVVGTSPNIGTGIALELAAAGAQVACVDVDAALARRAADEVRAAGGDAVSVTCDATSEPDVIQAIAAIRGEFGIVDVLVNGLVVYREKGIREMTLEQWHSQLKVLLDGTFLFTKYVAESLIEAGQPGAIINLASTAGHQGEPGNIGYATAKGGIVNMTRAVAMDLAPYGIRVNSLTPTATDPREGVERGQRWGVTGITSAHIAALDIAASQVPLGELPRPSDYGRAAVFLASSAARMITGIDLRVDAGSVAKYWRVKPSDLA